MNFDIVCKNCGAPSSPDIGVCPYCKTVMAEESEKKTPIIANIKKYFDDGNMDRALELARALEAKKPDSIKNKEFVLLYVKILIEVAAPSTKIKSLLLNALIENPSDPQLLEYLEVIEAESNVSRHKNDAGETTLLNIVRRNPENVHALFLLGRHLFWTENDPYGALRYMEQCVKLRPNFSKAKNCLEAIYKSLRAS